MHVDCQLRVLLATVYGMQLRYRPRVKLVGMQRCHYLLATFHVVCTLHGMAPKDSKVSDTARQTLLS